MLVSLFSKLDLFRDLLEENAYRLSDHRHMADMIPFVLKQEQDKIESEIEGSSIAIIFDGTSCLGEALAVVVHFVTEDFDIKQYLIQLQLLAKSLSGEEIAREIITVLSVDYGVKPSPVLSAMPDGASTNNVAVRTLSVLYISLYV